MKESIRRQDRRALEGIKGDPQAIIVALDIGVSLGVAWGRAGTAMPASDSFHLRKSNEPADVAFDALGNVIEDTLRNFTGRSLVVAKESPPHLNAFLKLGDSNAAVRTTLGYHAIIERECRRAGVPWDEENVQTVRKHFIGEGRLPRAEAKRAVLTRCYQLGYLPRDCDDNDRADALAVFDWASVYVTRRSPLDLVLFESRT